MKSITQVVQNLLKPYIDTQDGKIDLKISQLTASKIGYDGSGSGLSANKVQGAIDEVALEKFDKTGGNLSGDLVVGKTATTGRSAVVTEQINSLTGNNLAEIYANGEGGNLRLTKGGDIAHLELDTAAMNGSTGFARIYLGTSGTEEIKQFRFNEDGSFRDANGVNTGEINAEVNTLSNIGAKNIMPLDAPPHTENSVTFQLTKDNGVAVWGTATGGSAYCYVNPSFTVEEDGDYILSGTPESLYDDNVSGNGVCYLYIEDNTTGTHTFMGSDYGKGLAVSLEKSKVYYVSIGVGSGYAVPGGIVFYPMIRPATIKDGTFSAYSRTNAEITGELVPMLNDLGAKNLCPNIATSQTINDVVFTVNPSGYPDGTVKTNGTASPSQAILTITEDLDKLPDGEYLLSGAPAGGAIGAFWLSMANESDNNWVTVPNDGGDIAFHQASDNSGGRWKYLRIQIYAGYNADNLIFQPMIRPLTIKDDTYVPYAKTNRELTEYVTEVKDVTAEFTWNVTDVSGSIKSRALLKGNEITVELFGDFSSATPIIATIPSKYIPDHFTMAGFCQIQSGTNAVYPIFVHDANGSFYTDHTFAQSDRVYGKATWFIK